MARTVIKLDEVGVDFVVLAISCHSPAHRFCWALNNSLEIDLHRAEIDVNIANIKNKEVVTFAKHVFVDEEAQLEYALVANKAPNGFFCPDFKGVDYFMKLSGATLPHIQVDLLKKVKSLEIVLTAFWMDINQTRTKNNFYIL